MRIIHIHKHESSHRGKQGSITRNKETGKPLDLRCEITRNLMLEHNMEYEDEVIKWHTDTTKRHANGRTAWVAWSTTKARVDVNKESTWWKSQQNIKGAFVKVTWGDVLNFFVFCLVIIEIRTNYISIYVHITSLKCLNFVFVFLP